MSKTANDSIPSSIKDSLQTKTHRYQTTAWQLAWNGQTDLNKYHFLPQNYQKLRIFVPLCVSSSDDSWYYPVSNISWWKLWWRCLCVCLICICVSIISFLWWSMMIWMFTMYVPVFLLQSILYCGFVQRNFRGATSVEHGAADQPHSTQSCGKVHIHNNQVSQIVWKS